MTPLAEAVQAVREGTREAMEFYQLFLSTELLIPVDADPAENAEDAENEEIGPGDDVSILVVETEDGPVVPAFDAPEKLNEWAQQELPYVAVRGQVLLEVLETDLQVALNPNTDEFKLFERQELAELRDWALAGIEEGAERPAGSQLRLAPLTELAPDLDVALKLALERQNEIGQAYLLAAAYEEEPADSHILILLDAGESDDETFSSLARHVGLAIRPYFGEQEFFEIMRFDQGDRVSEAVAARGIEPYYLR